MTQEEKAKAYDEALKVTKNLIGAGLVYEDAAIQIFPELLKENDERIKNFINNELACLRATDDKGSDRYNELTEAITWVEKQSELVNYLSKGLDDAYERIDELIQKNNELCIKFEKQGEQRENATRDKISEYLRKLILDQFQRGFPMLNYEGRIEEEVDFIINIAKKELKQDEQKPAHKEYTFTAIPRLLEMIQPTERSKSYCQKLIDSLEQEGYSTDAKIVRERLKLMNGEIVAMATMDEQKPAEWSEEDSYMLAQAIKCVNNSGKLDVSTEEIEDWLKSLRPQPKQEWSEEDENKFKIVINALVEDYRAVPELINWFKALKERVRPNQEWSREDEEMIEGLNNCLDELEKEYGWHYVYINNKNVDLNKVRNWLKSLHPQSH